MSSSAWGTSTPVRRSITHPSISRGGRISAARYDVLADGIRRVLQDAIRQGGTTA